MKCERQVGEVRRTVVNERVKSDSLFSCVAHAVVYLLFNGLFFLLFSLFNVICEFNMFLHRRWAGDVVVLLFKGAKMAAITNLNFLHVNKAS